MTTGSHTRSAKWIRCCHTTWKTARITSPMKKCTIVAMTLTIGSTSAGNNTLRSRLPDEISDTADSFNDVVNHVHGSNPQKRNNGKGSSSGPCVPTRTFEKTNE